MADTNTQTNTVSPAANGAPVADATATANTGEKAKRTREVPQVSLNPSKEMYTWLKAKSDAATVAIEKETGVAADVGVSTIAVSILRKVMLAEQKAKPAAK